MSSKRKMNENDFEELKKAKPQRTLSSYMEEEREKMLLDKESLESIEIYLYESWKKLEDNVPLRYDQPPNFCQNHNIVQRDMLSSLLGTSNIVGSSTTDPFTHISSQACRLIHQHTQPDAAHFNTRPSTSQASNLDSSVPTMNNATLMAEIIALMRDWNPDLYQQCMVNYGVMRNRNTVFWDNMIMKALPPAMLEHCATSDIIADFFHSMCKEFHTMNLLVKIESSYMQFFLMNMAAVNRIEHSAIVRMWELIKRELVKRAFVAGQVTNLRLLLQYFRPHELWTCPTVVFVSYPSMNLVIRDPSTNDLSKLVSGYSGKLTLFNLARIATYVAESNVPKSVLGDCIRLLWRAAKSPYVTLETIRNSVEPPEPDIHTMRSMLVSITVMRACRKSLIDAYPQDCLMEDQPRSLMHLCRCTIRQSIISAVYVPFLPVPNHLIEYINLEW